MHKEKLELWETRRMLRVNSRAWEAVQFPPTVPQGTRQPMPTPRSGFSSRASPDLRRGNRAATQAYPGVFSGSGWGCEASPDVPPPHPRQEGREGRAAAAPRREVPGPPLVPPRRLCPPPAVPGPARPAAAGGARPAVAGSGADGSGAAGDGGARSRR